MKKVALVTGGTRGIGLGIAKVLGSQGFDLAVNGVRSEAEVTEVLIMLRATGAEVIYCQGDIAEASDREVILKEVRQHFGKLHLLVNNAGVAPLIREDLLITSEESFDRVVDTNLRGTFFLTQLAARWLVEQKQSDRYFEGSIIIISSISSTVASTNRGEYCISKAGLSMVTQLFSARLGEWNIPVYEIRPGVIDTDMTAGAKAKYDKLLAEGLFIQGRWGSPDDVGKAVGALATGQFPYSTGQVIMVDGGLTKQRI